VKKTIIITGASGLIGSEASLFFGRQGFDVVGVDNNMRSVFFGEEASTLWTRNKVTQELQDCYRHADCDVRDRDAVNRLFADRKGRVAGVIHTAAQPSHDWAVKDPQVDFSVNANGTLNLLEATRLYAPEAPFVFTSTNKVYGDRPNALPLVELDTRWEIDPGHAYANGIREDMSVDQTLHSLFGASKVAADMLVQEYGRYFNMPTVCFRGGCLTGPNHSGAPLHGFLSYLMRCVVTGAPYAVLGYKGKQVRDNIHSSDLVRAFDAFFRDPDCGAVYNIGGGRFSNCSMVEAIRLCEEISGKTLDWSYEEQNRIGDHIWWISDNGKFMQRYPAWRQQHDVAGILQEIHACNVQRWSSVRGAV
jgi:CDP-paratose 2-epimerase